MLILNSVSKYVKEFVENGQVLWLELSVLPLFYLLVRLSFSDDLSVQNSCASHPLHPLQLPFVTEEVIKLLGPKINVEKDPSGDELLSPTLCALPSTLCSPAGQVCKARTSFGCFFLP